MYRYEKHCMHTVIGAGPITVGIDTPRLEKDKVPHSGRGKRSSIGRLLMWLRKTKYFQVSVRVGFSPGSIVSISWGRTDAWALSTQGRGSRSWTLVSWIVCYVWKVNLLEYPVVVRLFNVCFPNLPVSHDLSRQGVLRRCQNRSRIPRLRLLFNAYIGLVKVFERRRKKKIRGGNRRVLHREHFLHEASVYIYEDTTAYSLLSWSRWGVVHVSRSCTTWFGSQRFCSSRGKDPPIPGNEMSYQLWSKFSQFY